MEYRAIRSTSINELYGMLAGWMEWGYMPVGTKDKFDKGTHTEHCIIIKRRLHA